MTGKTVVITGASSGIGKATAEALATLGAHVVMITRRADTGLIAKQAIMEESGSELVDQYTCDLSDLSQVRQLAEQLHEDLDKIDVLINNAGVMLRRRTETIDGYEKSLGVNYLAHFLLTQLLIDLLKKPKTARIINLTSSVHRMGNINFSDLDLTKQYTFLRAYAQSKLAMVVFTYGLCSRLHQQGISSNAVHPGLVGTRIGFGRNGEVTPWPLKVYQKIAKPVSHGANTVVFLASSHEVENQSGGYYVNKKRKASSRQSYDPDAATALWNISLQRCGLDKSLI